MGRHTRRQFLRTGASLGGAVALGAWGHLPAHAAEGRSMAIARWTGAAVDEAGVDAMAARLAQEAVTALGGMARFVKRGDVVWVKPNMAWNRKPELAANTNPAVVATIVTLCLEAGAKTVKVGDVTVHEAKQAYTGSGIEAAARKAGAEVVYVDENRFRDTAVNGERLKNWPLYPEIIESDLVINVPIVKHHSISGITLAMKNFMGVAGGNRGEWHQDLGACLSDLAAFLKPRLCILDAVRILTANGPGGGNLADVKRVNTVAASTDIVALDAFGASLLGLDPAAVGHIKAAHARGLGQIDYVKLAPQEIAVA